MGDTMGMKQWLGGLLGAAALAACAGRAPAALIYSFTLDAAGYEITPGVPVSVPVYFEETVTEADTSRLNSQNGLALVGVLLQKTTSDTAVRITGITPNSLFDGPVNTTPDPVPPFSVDTASLYETMLDPILTPQGGTPTTHGIMPTETAPGSGTWRVLIGTFEFSAIGNAGDSSTFQATMIGSLSDAATWDAYYGPNFTYETLGNNGLMYSSEVTLTIVPEPAAIWGLGAALVVLGMRRNRRT